MKRTMMVFLLLVLLILLLVVAVAAGWMIAVPLLEYQEGEQLYASLTESFCERTEDADEDRRRILSEIGVSPDFEALSAVNPEVIGWICVPNTEINYPVVQTTDNSYYLSHLVDGTENKNGTIFVDCQNAKDFSDANTVLYGHHMKNGTMLARIIQYQEQSFYDEHTKGYMITRDHIFQLDFFSGFTARADATVYRLTFPDPQSQYDWIRACYSHSDFTCSQTVAEQDKTITLSTCAYSFQEARYVLVGFLKQLA